MRVIVILGAAVWPGGEPSPTLKRRTNRAIALWRSGTFNEIIPSGGTGNHPPSEASVMRHLLLDAGIPATAIRLEDMAKTTMETACNVSSMLGAQAQITAVTDSTHALRTKIAFWAYHRRIATVTTIGSTPGANKSVVAKQALRECLAIPYYLAKALYTRGSFR